MGAEDIRSIGQAAWAHKMLHGGESDDTTQLGLTPLEVYRARSREIMRPEGFARTNEDDKAVYRAFWGENFDRKDDKDLAVAYLADRAMLEAVEDSYLAHIFRGTAVDFDTLHELKKIVSSAVRDAFAEGYATRFMETHSPTAE